MTLRSRNLLILLVFLLLSAGMVVYGLLIFHLDLDSPVIKTMLGQGLANYFDNQWKLSEQVLFINIVSPGISTLIAWLAAIIFLRYFRKITSPQLFFLVLFWLSMGTELVRVLNLFLITHDATLNQRILLSRIAIMGRLTGSLVLFAASLYSAGIKFQRQESVLVAAVIIAVSISWLVPFDMDRVGQELLFVPAQGYTLDGLRMFIGVLTILNFLKYAITTRDVREFVLIIPITFLLVGQELMFLSFNWIGTILTWLFLIPGSIWVTRRFISNYLWY